ncbi:MAG: CDP-alcohol phosphatidyltransferase family protein [Thermoplasmata archaeon]|nr:CDP-alcohol phosphatidyltransferase family protein [Thermoplasmata archaeon]
MVLDKYRKNVDSLVTNIAKPFVFFNPNTLSWISFIFALISGIFFYLGNLFLILASVSLIISAIFDAIDGKVARIKNIASKKGDFLDHLLDRYSDTAIIIGISLSAYAHWYFALFALTGIFFTSYAGTQAQAVSGKRDYGGMLGRADRLIIFIIMPIVQFFFQHEIFGYSFTDYVLIAIGILGNITAIQRSLRAWRNI